MRLKTSTISAKYVIRNIGVECLKNIGNFINVNLSTIFLFQLINYPFENNAFTTIKIFSG